MPAVGEGMTVSCLLADADGQEPLPKTVYVMVVVPDLKAKINPDIESTRATDGLLDAHSPPNTVEV
jgi:hypothetical protein